MPFYSDPGIAPEKIKKYLLDFGGFSVPRSEVLLILKQRAYKDRKMTARGEKDKIDIIALLKNTDFDFNFYL